MVVDNGCQMSKAEFERRPHLVITQAPEIELVEVDASYSQVAQVQSNHKFPFSSKLRHAYFVSLNT